jgi:hypothetical protein
MGNNAAKEFHATELGRGSMDGTEAELIAPEMVIRGKNPITIVEEDVYQSLVGKSNQLLGRHFINQETKGILFQIGYMLKSSIKHADKYTPRSIARDLDGCIIYVDKKIVMPDGQKRTMIYKTCPVYPNQPTTTDDVKVEMKQLYLAAVIFDCRHQANQNTACAYFAIVTGKNKLDDTGFKLQDLYRAFKIPTVKNGVLVVDMDGQPVGKSAAVQKGHCSLDTASSCYDTSIKSSRASFGMLSSTLEESTVYEIAPGAEAAAIIAVASSLF